jgi:hypothetical protein
MMRAAVRDIFLGLATLETAQLIRLDVVGRSFSHEWAGTPDRSACYCTSFGWLERGASFS